MLQSRGENSGVARLPATANLGVHNVEQVRQNVKHAAAFKPLSDGEREKLAKLGRQKARELGEHFGPIAEKKQETA